MCSGEREVDGQTSEVTLRREADGSGLRVGGLCGDAGGDVFLARVVFRSHSE